MAVKKTKKTVAKKTPKEKVLPSSEQKIKQLKRELEIESALEKVRAVVLLMKRSHDLIKACKVLYEQFEQLGFENIRDAQIAIADDEKGSYMNYEWYGHNKFFAGEVSYSSHPFIARMAKKMRSHKDRFFKETLKGDTLREWKRFLGKLSQNPAPRLKAATALHYNLYSIGVGALGICSYTKLNQEEISLLNRFKNVFEFCYSRYQEIKIAEKQAKEAKIEAAIEKIRGRSLAMQSTEELQDVVTLLFNQLKELQFRMEEGAAIIMIYHPSSKDHIQWIADPGQSYAKAFRVPDSHHLIPTVINEAREKSLGYFSRNFPTAEKNKYFRYLFAHSDYQSLPQYVKEYILGSKNYGISIALEKYSALAIPTNTGHLLTDEEAKILKRFSKVFDQAYARFLDLQKAEQQTREAQIQLALERVRARTMAMHKSEELSETAYVMFQQFHKLGEFPEQMTIGIMNEPEKVMEVYLTLHEKKFNENHRISLDEPHVIQKLFKAWKEKKHSIVLDLSGKKLREYDLARSRASKTKVISERTEKRRIITCAFFKQGLLSISAERPFPDETISILERFAAVFELTYTRFLDLQNAEAQAREAQIETALEKIRSRSLAMHQSGELKEVIAITFEKLSELNVLPGTVGIQLFDEKSGNAVIWVGNTIQDPEMVSLPYDKKMLLENTLLKDSWEAMQTQVDIINRQYSVQQKNKYFNYLFSNNDFTQIPRQARKVLRQMHEHIVCFLTEKNSAFLVDSWDGRLFPKENLNVIKRAAKVFEQAYIRFLDLKKAEAQTREAQIQLALERVRARAMAMQHTTELAELIDTVQKELTKLEFSLNNCILWIMEEKPAAAVWWTAPVNKTSLPTPYRVPFPQLPYFNAVYKAWQKRIPKWTYKLEKKDKKATDHYIFTETELNKFPQNVKKAFQSSEKVYISFSFYSYGGLHLSTSEPLTEEQMDVIDRFSKTFDLTYTRFLDLKKAESQAREAQIETALERVRSRTMGMRNSEELLDVIKIISDQFQSLGLKFDNVSFAVVSESHDYSFWTYIIGQPEPIQIHVPYLNHPMFERVRKARAKGDQFYTDTLTVEENRLWHVHMLKHAQLPFLKGEVKSYVMNSGYARSIAFMPTIMLIAGNYAARPYTEEQNRIISRFANVFEQSYTRFLDLKNAEAQAREAQIEASLERVRAKTIAMHNSSDVADTVQTMFNELVNLGVRTNRCGIGIMQEPMQIEAWTVKSYTGSESSIVIGHLDMSQHDLTRGVFNSWKEKADSFSYELRGEDLVNYFKVLNNSKDYPFQLNLDALPKQEFHNSFFFKDGAIYVFSGEALNAEAKQIFKRFAGVFGQTYRRYLDLQKAEAQAREAQIEASLERVRTKTIAMHNSSDVADTVQTMFNELVHLGIESKRCGIGIMHEPMRNETWIVKADAGAGTSLIIGDLDMSRHALTRGLFNSWKEKEENYSYELKGEDLVNYFKFLNDSPDYPLHFDLNALPSQEFNNSFFFNEGAILVFSGEQLNPEAKQIFKRFAGVFGQTYRRYLDLQKAETQAREAEIQLALERVRARTMAMHKSEELGEAAKVLFEQFNLLGKMPDRMSIGIINESTRKAELWLTDQSGNELSNEYFFALDEPTSISKIYKAWQVGKKSIVVDLTGKDLDDWLRFILEDVKLPIDLTHVRGRRVQQAALFSKGFLLFTTHEPVSEEIMKLLERFAQAFDLTYTRFLDLQKAEAQAKESQIQLALERVRARTMAMQKSEELPETAAVLFEQFRSLGQELMQMTIGIVREDQGITEFSVTDWSGGGKSVNQTFNLSNDEPTLISKMFAGWKQKKKSMVVDLYGKELENWLSYRNAKSGITVGSEDSGGHRVINSAFFSKGHLSFSSPTVPVAEKIQLLERFAAVFDLTYTRFLDLQKAEAQAREAQVEASLERVRAQTMAMHSSEGVKVAVATLFTELEKLGCKILRCGVANIYPNHTMDVWSVTNLNEGTIVKSAGNFDTNAHPIWKKAFDLWEQKAGYLSVLLHGKEKDDYFRILRRTPNYLQSDSSDFPDMYFNAQHFSEGIVWTFSPEAYTVDEKELLKRFTAVFSLTYKRYQDLKKAEARAREAQIETALEKVRSRSLAMHKSEELKEVIIVVLERLQSLGIVMENRSALILVYESGYRRFTQWVASSLRSTAIGFETPYTDNPILRDFWEAREKGVEFYEKAYSKEVKNALFKYFIEELGSRMAPDVREYLFNNPHYSFAVANEKNSSIAIASHFDQHLSPEEVEIIKRFARVFEQSYIRFLDLQKAEAQAREAQIEAALERIRTKAQAMRSSEDLLEVVSVMREQMSLLGQPELESSIIHLYSEDGTYMEAWYEFRPTIDSPDRIVKDKAIVTFESSEWAREVYQNYLSDKKEYTLLYSGERLKEWYQVLQKVSPRTIDYDDAGNIIVPERLYYHFSKFSGGALLMISNSEPSKDSKDLQRRASTAFDLAYQRHKDLKKAEAQAREAAIEASLEKVRSKAMAMHSSQDLSETASMVFSELRKLGIESIRCGVAILSRDTTTAQIYVTTSTNQGDDLALMGSIDNSRHPALKELYESWLQNTEAYPELSGESLKQYYQLLSSSISIPSDRVENEKLYGNFIPFSNGCLFAWATVLYSEAERNILKRFASIIDLTFRRYSELQKSEENAREAIKQAALDRIRADIASMRTISDLDRITPLIWNELKILGLPFIRCGVFIIDETKEQIHTFLSNAEGKAIAAFHQPFDTPGSLSKVLENWKKRSQYIDHWNESDFTSIAETLVEQGAIQKPDDYLKEIPREGFYLHFLPFLQGMLYVGNSTELSKTEIDLIQSVADAFSTAYARYEDFVQLDNAKQQVEKTLGDLKQAQQQLVQSEKMASLGELTAGIAHEIQNPLNFVNNFSDINRELIEEVREEIKKGDLPAILSIANDLDQNLEKIAHHGKRADDIVKSMLQHSRSSSGQKEPTDINALCDEYLRLSYHGMRAKDKSFNAQMETHFDPAIGKIDMVPQEIGRVLLNLFNNAFYAVIEKSKLLNGSYHPVVTVSTGKTNQVLEIKIRDNGNGIPENIQEKIFQPFFTTRPTGQGTGLGLSLSYDIIKLHGGEIKFQTAEGEGTEFVIKVPIN